MKWAGGNNFTVTSSSELTAYNPNVITLKIVTTPVPVALIHAYYPSGCARSYARPSAILTGNNVDIRLKGWAPTGVVCTAMAALFVESVALPVVADNQTYTYTINGVSVAPTY
ncbi:MAG: hypothetical protein NT159_22780 [Proteobacteria bacterium]|nr:hypothetical protein [Pseudomonadota bacterium]